MSELTKSNFHAFVAGLVGFVAVVAIGGGALVLHSKNAKTGPVAAGAPIDLASSVHAPAPVSRFAARSEAARPQQSPAPLIGETDEEAAESAAAESAAPAKAAAAARAESGPIRDAKNAPRLVAGGGVDGAAPSAHTSAELRFKDKVVLHDEAAAKADPKLGAVAAKKPEAQALASVKYGVTSRSELMGRAAGPVYNFSGGQTQKGAVGALAGQTSARIAELRGQLEKTGLAPEDREKVQKELDAAVKAADAAGKTAQ
jgi:hypothetical protein